MNYEIKAGQRGAMKSFYYGLHSGLIAHKKVSVLGCDNPEAITERMKDMGLNVRFEAMTVITGGQTSYVNGEFFDRVEYDMKITCYTFYLL